MSEIQVGLEPKRIVIEQDGKKKEVSEQEAYDKVNEINEDPNKEAKVVENEVVVKDVLKG